MKKTKKQLQEEHNKAIIEALKAGKPTPRKYNNEDTWFPERPVIKKDKKAMDELYGEKSIDE